jgi:hypothetical protein
VDCTQSTFERMQALVTELHKVAPENILIAIVGHNFDLQKVRRYTDSEREVTFDEAKRFAEDVKAVFMETSVTSNAGIREMFNVIGTFLSATREVQAAVSVPWCVPVTSEVPPMPLPCQANG